MERSNANSPRRLLYIGNHAGYFLTHRLPAVAALRDTGFEVHVAAPSDSDELERTVARDAPARIRDLGFTFHSIPMRRGSTGLLGEARVLKSIDNVVRDVRPDLIFNATLKPALYGSIVARVRRTPAVMSSLTGLGYLFVSEEWNARVLRVPVRLLFRAAFSHPNIRVLFQNEDDRTAFVEHRLVPRSKTTLIRGSGVDLERFSATTLPDGPPIVVLPSRLLWDKGVGEFVEAARSLRRSGVDARFVLAGAPDPDNPASIETDQITAWVDEGAVEWSGWVSDMSGLLREASIVCLPSYREGIPKSLIEAAASGRPIVTTDAPGCRDTVLDGETGLIVPVRDSAALTDALASLLDDRDRRSEMGRRGRLLAEREFSVSTIARQTIAVCQELTA